MTPDHALFLTLDEVASSLSLSGDEVRQCIARGELRVTRVAGQDRVFRDHLDEFAAWVLEGGRWPPESSVHAFLDACAPVGRDALLAGWFEEAGIARSVVEAADLCRSIDTEGPLPPWARTSSGSWVEEGYRLIVPMWDRDGCLRSVRAWRRKGPEGWDGVDPLVPGTPEHWGHEGLVMADLAALALLRHPSVPPGDHRYAVEAVSLHGLLLATTLTGYLREAAALESRGFDRSPVLGLAPESWSRAVAAAIPAGAVVRLVGAVADPRLVPIASSLDEKGCRVERIDSAPAAGATDLSI